MSYSVAIDLNNENNPQTQIVNKIPQYANVLELGCGYGEMSQILKQRKSARVIGIEVNAEAAHNAENICDYVFIEDLDCPHSLDVLQFEKFDTITLIDVLEHLRNPVEVLQRLKPLLLDEGRLILSVPNVAHVSRRLALLCGTFNYTQANDQASYRSEYFYTSESIQALLREAGYTVHEMDYTWHDLSDEEIERHLNQAGLEISEAALDFFHCNENAAYEFIISASPCHQNALSLPVTRKLKSVENNKNQRCNHLQEPL